MVAQELRGHHRRQREGDDARDDDGAGEREGEFAEERAGQARGEADRRIDCRQRDGHADHRQGDLAGALQGGVERLACPSSMCRWTFSTTTMASSTTRPMASTSASRVEKVDRIAHRQQQHQHADERQGNGDDRDERRADRAQEQEDHHDDDDRRLAERLGHFLDRFLDEDRGVIGDRRLEPGRQLRLDFRHGLAHVCDDGERVGRRRRIDADEHRLQPVEGRRRN